MNGERPDHERTKESQDPGGLKNDGRRSDGQNPEYGTGAGIRSAGW